MVLVIFSPTTSPTLRLASRRIVHYYLLWMSGIVVWSSSPLIHNLTLSTANAEIRPSL